MPLLLLPENYLTWIRNIWGGWQVSICCDQRAPGQMMHQINSVLSSLWHRKLCQLQSSFQLWQYFAKCFRIKMHFLKWNLCVPQYIKPTKAYIWKFKCVTIYYRTNQYRQNGWLDATIPSRVMNDSCNFILPRVSLLFLHLILIAKHWKTGIQM